MSRQDELALGIWAQHHPKNMERVHTRKKFDTIITLSHLIFTLFSQHGVGSQHSWSLRFTSVFISSSQQKSSQLEFLLHPEGLKQFLFCSQFIFFVAQLFLRFFFQLLLQLPFHRSSLFKSLFGVLFWLCLPKIVYEMEFLVQVLLDLMFSVLIAFVFFSFALFMLSRMQIYILVCQLA